MRRLRNFGSIASFLGSWEIDEIQEAIDARRGGERIEVERGAADFAALTRRCSGSFARGLRMRAFIASEAPGFTALGRSGSPTAPVRR